MIRTKTLACCLYLLVGISPAAADADTTTKPPKSLTMRSRPHDVRALPLKTGRRVAQAPAQDPAPADAAPVDPAAAASPDPAAEAVTDGQAPPAVDTAAELSEADFEKLAEQDFSEEIIVVTGSTIGRKTVTTPAPLSILDRELLSAAGQPTVGDIIQQLPAQANAGNAQLNVNGEGSTRVDMRGLGSQRTLTLINGRRVVPSGVGANVSVDLNTIPLAIVERVEVLKDGASAVYGSDAVGGVVNVITRSDFQGNEAQLFTGTTQRGDGLSYDASFVTGHNSDNNKGNLVFSAGLQRQEPVFAGDRSYSANDMTYDYANRTVIQGGSTATPGGRINTRAIDTNADGRPDAVDLCGAGVQFCTADGAGGYRPFIAPDDLYNYQPLNYLYTPASRYHLFSAGSYQMRPAVSMFFEGTYTNRKSEQQIAEELFVNAAPISSASMYNPLGGTVLGYQRRMVEFGPKLTTQNVNTFRMVGGFKGKVPDDVDLFKNFKWEVSYNYGRNDAEQINTGHLSRSRLANALGPSFMSSAGVPTCGTPTRPIAGCVPMNILGGAGSIDPSAAQYVMFTGVRSGFNEQQTALAQANGRIATLPNNGDISVAAGGNFRRESGASLPDPLTVAGDTTGNPQAPTAGSYNVVEGFAELSVVPVSGKKYAEWVELSAAARAFRYNTFGSGVTWKAGGMFRTINGFAVRGTYSTSFRAPSIAELYQGRTEVVAPLTDPCDTRPLGTTITLDPEVAAECANQGVPANAAFGSSTSRLRAGGNEDLEPETAGVVTAGIVFEPPQAKGLSLTVDYWRNKIKGNIQGLGAGVILGSCYMRHDQAACAQVHRNPALGNAIDYVDTTIQNVGGSSGAGVDVAVGYDIKLGAAGRFREQLESQYLLKSELDNTFQVINGLRTNELGPRPRLRATFSSLWQHPSGVGAGVNARYISSYRECDTGGCSAGALARTIEDWYKLDLFGSHTFKSRAGTTSLTLGVNNVLDRDPPLVYGALFGDYDGTNYDFKGRMFYARMSQQF